MPTAGYFIIVLSIFCHEFNIIKIKFETVSLFVIFPLELKFINVRCKNISIVTKY